MPLMAQRQGPITPNSPINSEEASYHEDRFVPSHLPGLAMQTAAHLPGMPPRSQPAWSLSLEPEESTVPFAPVADLVEEVAIPAGTRIAVVLETPLSTKFSREGQTVIYRTTRSVALAHDLELPPNVEIRGRVTEVIRPGMFGKAGGVRVRLERILLPGGTSAALRAQLRAPEPSARGRISGDGQLRRSRPGNMESLAMLSAQGTYVGARAGGAKAAAIGAGAGAALAAVLMMSQKGTEVSIPAGTAYFVRLRADANLSSSAVFSAHQDYVKTRAARAAYEDTESRFERAAARPVLKRRSAPATQP
jgi:hypothetical protein